MAPGMADAVADAMNDGTGVLPARVGHQSWRERMAMTAVFVANGTAFGAWAGNIPRLREAAGLQDASLGMVLLSVSLGAVAAMQVAGRYGAKVGTARGSWVSALLLAAALPVPALAPGYAALLAAGAMLGLGLGLLDVCMNAHAAWMERRWDAPIMSSFHAGWSAGQLAGAALAGVLAGIGLVWSLAVAGLLVALLGASAAMLPEERGRSKKPVAFGWPTRWMVLLGALVALSFAVEGGTADWSGVYLRTVLGAPEAWASSGLAVFAGAMLVMRLTGDALVHRMGAVWVLCGGATVAAAGLLLAVLAPAVWVASAGFALVGVGTANIVPIGFSAAGRDGAAGVSVVATFGYGAVMATPAVIGLVAHAYGLRAGLMLLVIGAGVTAILGRGVRE